MPDYLTRLKWSIRGSYAIAVIKLILAMVALSPFTAVNALYTVFVGTGKQYSRKGMLSADSSVEKQHYRMVGKMTVVAGLVFIAYSSLGLFSHRHETFGLELSIGIAAVTFTEIVVSVVGIFQANKNHDLMMRAVKMLNLASAMIGLNLTQAALLSATNTTISPHLTVVSGIFFGIIGVGMGLWMVLGKRVMVKFYPHEFR